MFPHKVSELDHWFDSYLSRVRLHLLIIASASLESYLTDIAFYFIAQQGYLQKSNSSTDLLELNAVGRALGAPIMQRASIPEPLKYAEKSFDVELGEYRKIWNKAYHLRCVTAHNGGMVMPAALKRIPDLSIPEFDLMGINWSELRKCMNAADQIVTIIDRKVSNYLVRVC